MRACRVVVRYGAVALALAAASLGSGPAFGQEIRVNQKGDLELRWTGRYKSLRQRPESLAPVPELFVLLGWGFEEHPEHRAVAALGDLLARASGRAKPPRPESNEPRLRTRRTAQTPL